MCFKHYQIDTEAVPTSFVEFSHKCNVSTLFQTGLIQYCEVLQPTFWPVSSNLFVPVDIIKVNN